MNGVLADVFKSHFTTSKSPASAGLLLGEPPCYPEIKLLSPDASVFGAAVPPTGSGVTLVGVVRRVAGEITQRHTGMRVP